MIRGKSFAALTALAGSTVLGGCAQYNIAGDFEATGQPFYGTVMVTIGDMGTLDVTTADGSVTCSGASRVTKRPSGYALTGAQGSATAKCSDGRSFKVDFIQTSESGGHGKGIDNSGQIVRVFFDTSASAAKSRLDMQRLNSLVE